jgi:hypothetical protein
LSRIELSYLKKYATSKICFSKRYKKQSRYTPWRRLGGEEVYSSYSFTTSALDGGEWSASRPGRALTPGEKTTGTHWTGGWVGPRAGLDTEDRGKILCPCRGSNPDRPVVQPVVRHCTAWANPAPYSIWGTDWMFKSYWDELRASDSSECYRVFSWSGCRACFVIGICRVRTSATTTAILTVFMLLLSPHGQMLGECHRRCLFILHPLHLIHIYRVMCVSGIQW